MRTKITSVNQIKLHSGETMTIIELGRFSRTEALKIQAKLDGQTYMDFEIVIVSAGGEVELLARTIYDDTADNILGMLLYVLSSQIVDNSALLIKRIELKEAYGEAEQALIDGSTLEEIAEAGTRRDYLLAQIELIEELITG